MITSATKQVMIDKECNDEDQQAAAKDFLDWLANTAEGNKVLVDDCSLVPAFSNITEDATDMLGQSIQRYTVEGKLFDQPSNYPGDHWSEVGAIMEIRSRPYFLQIGSNSSFSSYGTSGRIRPLMPISAALEIKRSEP